MRKRFERNKLDREIAHAQAEKYIEFMAALINKLNWMLNLWLSMLSVVRTSAIQ